MGPTGITPLHHWISFDEFNARHYWTRCNKTVWGMTCRFKRDPTTLQWDPIPVQFGYLAFQLAIEKYLRITWVPPGKYAIRLASCHIKIRLPAWATPSDHRFPRLTKPLSGCWPSGNYNAAHFPFYIIEPANVAVLWASSLAVVWSGQHAVPWTCHTPPHWLLVF